MKKFWIFLLVFTLLGCTTAPLVDEVLADVSTVVAPLPDLGEAPELTNDIWLNTDVPLRMADLRGNVVLIEMWTYG
jgi:hypothetical protein